MRRNGLAVIDSGRFSAGGDAGGGVGLTRSGLWQRVPNLLDLLADRLQRFQQRPNRCPTQIFRSCADRGRGAPKLAIVDRRGKVIDASEVLKGAQKMKRKLAILLCLCAAYVGMSLRVAKAEQTSISCDDGGLSFCQALEPLHCDGDALAACCCGYDLGNYCSFSCETEEENYCSSDYCQRMIE